jgi:hypothetical protein
MVAAGVLVIPNYLARGVGVTCFGAREGEGIVEGDIGVDWHGRIPERFLSAFTSAVRPSS